MDIALVSLAVFAGVTALIAALGFVLKDFGGTTAEDRLSRMTQRPGLDGGDENSVVKDDLVAEGLGGLQGLATAIITKFGNMKLLFEQADSPIRADTFFFICLGTGALCVAAAMIARAPVPMFPVAGMFGFALPWGWLLFRRRQRFSKFESQLPDAMELIGRALRSGHSLSSGLNVVVEEMPEPISVEFNMAFEEQNLGVPIEKALKNMLRRMPNMDLKFFVTAVAIQRQSGGDLAEILDKISHIIRERFKILGQVKALTGEGRISGVVLMGLPIALFFAVYYLNPDYVMLLFTEELGRKMVVVAVIAQIIGAIVIKKIVDIKV